MPQAKASEFQRVASRLGFAQARQKGSHQRWIHPDGRATTIPVHASTSITGRLFYDIVNQLGTTEEEFNRLR